MTREQILRCRVRCLTWIFIFGLLISGVTAIPLLSEVNFLVQLTGADKLLQNGASDTSPAWAVWLVKVQRGLRDVNVSHPFLFYGTDWIAFGHFVIAIAFIGALRDPVRNLWLFTFGIIACALVTPYALVFGAIRGIPFWWRLIDSSFGIFGLIPVWLCRTWALQLAASSAEPKQRGGA